MIQTLEVIQWWSHAQHKELRDVGEAGVVVVGGEALGGGVYTPTEFTALRWCSLSVRCVCVCVCVAGGGGGGREEGIHRTHSFEVVQFVSQVCVWGGGGGGSEGGIHRTHSFEVVQFVSQVCVCVCVCWGGGGMREVYTELTALRWCSLSARCSTPALTCTRVRLARCNCWSASSRRFSSFARWASNSSSIICPLLKGATSLVHKTQQASHPVHLRRVMI